MRSFCSGVSYGCVTFNAEIQPHVAECAQHEPQRIPHRLFARFN